MTTDLDRLFDPSATFVDDDPLAPVHAFFGEVRDTYGRLPAPEPRADLASRFRDESERAAVIPLRPAHSTARTRARRLRRAMLVAATLAVAVVTTGGLAVAGALPDSMQNTVSDFLDRVGIDVPHGPPSSTPPPIPSTPDSARSDGAPAAPADGNAGTRSGARASRTPAPGEAARRSADPGAAPDTTMPPKSTTAVPGVAPPLPVEPTRPVDVPLPPAAVPPVPPAPQVELPSLPPDVSLPPQAQPSRDGPPGPPSNVSLPPQAQPSRDDPPGPPGDVSLPPQAQPSRDGPPGPPSNVSLPPQARPPGR